MSPITYTGVVTTYVSVNDVYRGGYNGPGTTCFLQVEYDFGTPTLVNSAVWTLNAHRNVPAGGTNTATLFYDDVSKATVDIPYTTSPADRVLTYNTPETVTKIRVLSGIFTIAAISGGQDLIRCLMTLP